MSARRWASAAAVIAVALPSGARADAPPQITVQSSLDEVEVGDRFQIQLKAMVENGSPAPSDPELRAPPSFQVDGPSLGTQTIINGFGARAQVKVGISATWSLAGSRPGTFTIPAPTVLWNGKRMAGSPVQIRVVPASGRPKRQPQQNNPFLLPGGPMGPGGSGFPFSFPFGPQDEPHLDDEGSAVPDLAMPTAPDPLAFIRAVVDKKSAVVGEQVTLSFYTYVRADLLGRTGLAGFHEAPLADFVRVPLLKDAAMQQAQLAMVGGQKFKAKLFDRVAIFPVRTGDLHTGSLRVTYTGPRYGRAGGDRETQDHVIRVTEPPRAGRPPGYALGDVGQMALAASVQPQRIAQGGSVAVTITLTGTGNLPQSLRVPERTGLEWLDPEKKDAIEPQNGVVRGSRTFGYVVRIADSGRVELGDVKLPYWDPTTKSYQVATASLGAVEVTPVAPPSPAASGAPAAPAGEPVRADPFVGLPGARATLSAYTPVRRVEHGGGFWVLLAAPPLLVTGGAAGARALKRARTRRAESAGAPAALAARAMAEAKEAEAKGDARALAAAIDRGVHLAIEAATGLKSRGVLLADLPDELARAGLPHALGAAARGVLSDCEAVRFEPSPDVARTRDLAARESALVADLGRARGPRRPSAAEGGAR